MRRSSGFSYFYLRNMCKNYALPKLKYPTFFFVTVQKYSVMARFSDPPLMCMERAATSKFSSCDSGPCVIAVSSQWCCFTGLFGVKRYGVHINGYTVSDNGDVNMWLARRSATKQTFPGLLDNMVRVHTRENIHQSHISNIVFHLDKAK